MKEEKCYCPYLDIRAWDDQEQDWTGKKFYCVSHRSWLYVPRENITEKILQAYEEIVEKGYEAIPGGLMLFKKGFLKGEILIEIKNGSEDDKKVKIFRGHVLTKVYIGPRRDLSEIEKMFPDNVLNIYSTYFSCNVCEPDDDQQKTVLIGEKRFY
jgi:hypothetical protein